jgi:peptidoglycan/LPS O-acetylase OafA/YrhL
MTFAISDPVFQTSIFTTLLVAVLALTSRPKKHGIALSSDVSLELKGFSILAVIFAHIGYYLSQDQRFLFPLSIAAGIGINTFLFLSGYGLTHSMVTRPTSIFGFYAKRLSRIYLPLWILLITLLCVDAFFLHLTYPLRTVVESFFGFYPKANLYESINAPLWYLTITIFYYLLFPLVFIKKAPWVSAIIVGAIGYWVVHLHLPVDEGVLGLYQSHYVAFPLGMLAAALSFKFALSLQRITHKLEWPPLRGSLLFVLILIFAYTAFHSGVGKGLAIEQRTSLISMSCLLGIFVLDPFQHKFLQWIGKYSYQVYLIHWPLLYRYDPLYAHLPASVVTFAYLYILVGIAWASQQLERLLLVRKKKIG